MKSSNDQVVEWKNVSYLPPNFEVSNDGQVRRYVTLTETELVSVKLSAGYRTVYINGGSYSVAKLVADAFVPNPNNLPIVIHRNRVKTDDCAANLEWAKSKLYSESTRGSDSRNKIYCVETDTVYGSLRSACYFTRIPQEFISAALKDGQPVLGRTFKEINCTDPLLTDHNVFYLAYEDTIEIAHRVKSEEEFDRQIREICGNGIKLIM